MSAHADAIGSVNGIHRPYHWTFADATARAVATDPISGVAYVAASIGKFALQSDTNVLYMLTATTPTWVSLSGDVQSGTIALGALGTAAVALSTSAAAMVACRVDSEIAGTIFITKVTGTSWIISSTAAQDHSGLTVFWIAK